MKSLSQHDHGWRVIRIKFSEREEVSWKLFMINLKQDASLDQLHNLSRLVQEAACLIFSIPAWHCSYDILRFWPNVLINEVLMKKIVIYNRSYPLYFLQNLTHFIIWIGHCIFSQDILHTKTTSKLVCTLYCPKTGI